MQDGGGPSGNPQDGGPSGNPQDEGQRDDSRSALSPIGDELLDAIIALGSDLHLGRVLDRIVESACQLARAQYGALGVIGADDRFEAFVTYGVDEDTREDLGPGPAGRGLLGELMRHPSILRLEQVREHPSFTGFPSGHPEMQGFLGVPVRVRGTVFGNLFLMDKLDGGPFTDADEEVVLALAAAAGFVIENARAYTVSERQRRWLEAAARIAESVTAETPTEDALGEVAGNMRTMTGARAVAIVASEEDEPALLVSDGPEAATMEQLLEQRRAAVGQALEGTERHLHYEDGRTVLLLPLFSQIARSTALVVLLGEPQPGVPHDFQLIRSFADQAALTLDRAQAVRDRASMAVVSDRERIARDLHDSVIQRLFACGLLVHSAVSAPAEGGVDPIDVLTRVGDSLDQTIADIRTTIFELQSTSSTSLRGRVLALAREFTQVLGFTPAVRSHGAVDTVVAGALADEVLAVLREALTNVARHARATSAWVELMVTPDELSIVVGDNGIGLPAERRESGLANMATRATRLGGVWEATAPPEGGTLLRWSVPLQDPGGRLS